VLHIQMTESDHCALLVTRNMFVTDRSKSKPFSYENMWRRHASSDTIVKQGWISGGRHLISVQQSLTFMQGTMTAWEQDQFGSVWKELKKLRRRLEYIRANTLRTGLTREGDIRKRLAFGV
jgi:hypothetical protein